jgi:hypothetical protein
MGPLAGAGFGIAKSELVDRPNEARDREIQAVTAALSPWTGLKAAPVKEANWQEAALGGAQAGLGDEQQQAAAEQAMQDKDMQRQMMQAQMSYLNRQGGGGMPPQNGQGGGV